MKILANRLCETESVEQGSIVSCDWNSHVMCGSHDPILASYLLGIAPPGWGKLSRRLEAVVVMSCSELRAIWSVTIGEDKQKCRGCEEVQGTQCLVRMYKVSHKYSYLPDCPFTKGQEGGHMIKPGKSFCHFSDMTKAQCRTFT